MRTTWLVTVSGTACTLAILAACATDGEAPTALADDASTPLPSAEADAGGDAETGEDASVCVDDCEYYPDACTDDALCESSLFGAVASSETLYAGTHVQAIAARSPTDAWLVGTVGAAAHFDGISWKPSVTDTQYSFSALWLRGDAEIAFNNPKQLYTRGLDTDAGAPSAGGWSLFGSATLHPAWVQINGRVSTSWAHAESTSLWLGVATVSERGGLWRLRPSTGGGFAVTPATLDKCGRFVPCREVYGIDGRSADEVWAVGPRGAAFRVTNAEADEPTLTGFETDTLTALQAVWVAGTNDVWAVGASGTVRRWRGDPRLFETYNEVPTQQHLRAIAGSSPSDIWIAGDEGTVFHYDGTTWSRVKVAGLGGRRPQLERIWIPSPGKVWIAGRGALLSLGGKP